MWCCFWQVVRDICKYNSAFVFRAKQCTQNSQSSWSAWPWRCIRILCNVYNYSHNNRTGTLWSDLWYVQRRQFQQVWTASCIAYMQMALWTVNINYSSVDCTVAALLTWNFVFSPMLLNPYPTAFPYGNGMVLHFYQQQEGSTTKTVHKVINKGLKTYV